MRRSAFDEVHGLVSAGTWDEAAAARLGFGWCARSLIPAGEAYVAVVLGAGPASFGSVEQLLDRGVLVPSPDRPPVLVVECGERPGIRSVYGGAFWPADPVIFPN